jgi:cell division septum initiation protein DivIVA
MDCEFCKKTFSSKSNLTAHQKSAKFCLNLQGANNDDTDKKFTCDYCQKTLTQQKSLDVHIVSCKEKKKTLERTKDIEQALTIKRLEMEIIKLKRSEKEKLREKNEYIAKLEAKLEKFEDAVVTNMAATTHVLESKAAKASSAASTTNNTTLNTNITVNNVLNLSQEHVKKVLSERLDYNVVYGGQAGLATFVFNNILKDAAGKLIYRCVDASRQMFEFVDENGETVRDMKAEKLTQSLLKGDVIKLGLEAAAVGWNTENEKLNTERVGVFGPKVNEYADLNRNNTVFRSKVSSLTT